MLKKILIPAIAAVSLSGCGAAVVEMTEGMAIGPVQTLNSFQLNRVSRDSFSGSAPASWKPAEIQRRAHGYYCGPSSQVTNFRMQNAGGGMVSFSGSCM
ncbi:hypothetical protein [Aestuariibius sp. HNIBRBA575]|uniref:hypothetical protein n=1 Tax=Aestuariibius sp. HNIBRBA575 TaxID=3233343 RepID=UPI0034A23911